MTDRKLREFKCLYDPERDKLTYGYKPGCVQGLIEMRVREVSPELDAAYVECERVLQECAAKHSASFFDPATKALAALREARGE
jgi:hypothetical protein